MKNALIIDNPNHSTVYVRAIVFALLFLSLFTVYAHALHLDIDTAQSEHYQCQLCQGNIDAPNVSIEPIPVVQFVSYLSISDNIAFVFIADDFVKPPLRAPPDLSK